MPDHLGLPPEAKIMAAHVAATTAAIPLLVTALQEGGLLRHGAHPELVRIHLEGQQNRGGADPLVVTLLGDLRKALINCQRSRFMPNPP